MADGADKTTSAAPMWAVIEDRLTRRGLLGGLAALPLLSLADARAQPAASTLTFTSVAATHADTVTVPPGYTMKPLIAWGDALFEGMAPFDPKTLTAAEQEKRFGQNNDMLALFATAEPTRFLLCANHEYVEPALVYPGIASPREITAEMTDALVAAHGVSVVRIEHGGDGWRVIRDAAPGAGLNRRITPLTPVLFDGPAAGHRWVTAASTGWNMVAPSSVAVAVACGTIANCAGGQTPWGTYLTAEENFDGYFALSALTPEVEAAQGDAAWLWSSGSFGTPLFAPVRSRGMPARYDTAKNPYASALYGWIVEIDPHDPTWTPKKRTALGRAKHECATTALAKDGRVVVYSGDDQINEYVYKFVSHGKYDAAADRTQNRDLLSEGQLYAARFDANGGGEWLALTVDAANKAAAGYSAPFTDAGDVVMRCREAAKLMGATQMDRPEDVEALLDANWVGRGTVLVVCTNNRNEQPPRPGNPARERAPGDNPAQQSNHTGHILRIEEAGHDCAATRFRWDVFALAGDPAATSPTIETPNAGAAHVSVKLGGKATISGDRFACPDNICFDANLNVWIATDGAPAVFGDCNDAVVVTSTGGTGPRPMKRFLVGPVGCEICGPTMAPDQKSFFVAIQHPGEADAAGNPYSDLRWRTGAAPVSSFPDGAGAWPRSAVVVITRDDGGVIGT